MHIVPQFAPFSPTCFPPLLLLPAPPVRLMLPAPAIAGLLAAPKEAPLRAAQIEVTKSEALCQEGIELERLRIREKMNADIDAMVMRARENLQNIRAWRARATAQAAQS